MRSTRVPRLTMVLPLPPLAMGPALPVPTASSMRSQTRRFHDGAASGGGITTALSVKVAKAGLLASR